MRIVAWRRLAFGLLAAGAVALIAAAGWWVWAWATRPALPAVDLAGADPAVVEAVASASAGVRAAPNSDAAWAKLGVVFYAHDYYPQAAVCFERAARLNPRLVQLPALQAAVVRDTDPEAAIALYERALELSGDASDELEPALAELYLQQGRFTDARKRFEHVLTRHPDDPRAHLGLARAAAEENDHAGSLVHLKFAMDDPHTRRAAYRLLAEVQERRGDQPAAVQARASAEAASEDLRWPVPLVDDELRWPVGVQARLNRVQALEKQGRHDEALEMAAKVEGQFPAVYWLVEGRMKRGQGRLAESEEALQKAIGFDPDSIDARFELGEVLMRREKYAAAAECFEQLLRREPTQGRAYHNLGRCRKELGDRAGAVEAYRKAVTYAPFHFESRRDLAELLLQDGQTAEALDQLHKALELQPDDKKAKELLGQASK